MNRPNNTITIENAKIIWKDFSGERSQFNNDRTFHVAFTEEDATKLKADGWPIKLYIPKDDNGLPKDGAEPVYHLQVKLVFGKRPPKIMLVSGNSRKQSLDENTVGMLDWVQFEKADVIIRPYNYDFGGRSGTKAYLNTLYVTKSVDPLDEKYADIPEDTEDVPWGNER